jgi:hypothetical protein
MIVDGSLDESTGPRKSENNGRKPWLDFDVKWWKDEARRLDVSLP